MSRRPHRVPRTHAPRYRREIVCGIDPIRALASALVDLPFHPGQVWSVGIGHDDGCPSLERGGMPACTCELVRLEARRAA